MLAVVKRIWTIVTLPARLLWRAYMGLWWAFDDSERSPTRRAEAAEVAAGQSAAFEVVDSTPRPRPAPLGRLRAGFAACVLVCVSAGVGLGMFSSAGVVEAGTAALGWAWATAASMVTSVWLVRRGQVRRGTRSSAVCGRGMSDRVRRVWWVARSAVDRVAGYVRRPAPHSGRGSATR